MNLFIVVVNVLGLQIIFIKKTLITNTKFNAVLDNCKEVVESQIEILNALTPTEKTKYEIASRKKLIKELIGKVDDLTNELILSEENNIEDVIDDMDNLINSV